MTEVVVAAPRAEAEAGASPEAIQAHYDVSNDFFALWLDPTMAYSCALWEPGDTLEQAQLRKLDFHLTQANATHKSNLLDVGCGWGALLDRAASGYNVKNAVGLTLSQAQADWVTKSKRETVSVLLESWRDHKPSAPYDAIVSIGAFEHFAKAGLSSPAKADAYRSFFRWCHDNSTEDCDLSLQSIVYEIMTMETPTRSLKRFFPSLSFRVSPRFSRPATDCLKSSRCVTTVRTMLRL